MYILIPLILILGSLIGIVVIVYRKLTYLKKLTPESHEFGDNILEDFFPELMARLDRDMIKNYQQGLLRELEKLVRRTRLVFLKFDHLSERLIKRIRRSHVSAAIEKAEVLEESIIKAEETTSPHVTVVPKSSAETLLEELKAQEQKLIVEIAQNPKNSALYEHLGDLYLKMDNFQDAKDSYEAALELKPTDESLARKYSQVLRSMLKTSPIEAKA